MVASPKQVRTPEMRSLQKMAKNGLPQPKESTEFADYRHEEEKGTIVTHSKSAECPQSVDTLFS